MKTVWKRRGVAAAVLLLVCGAVYMNWRYSDSVKDNKVLGQSELVNANEETAGDPAPAEDDYFATARLSRKQARDNAIYMLQEAESDENAEESVLNEASRTYRRLGIEIIREGDDLFIPEQEHYEIESFIDGSFMTISDAPWPGLTPDLLSVLLVVATQAKGSVLIHQKMFESRLFFVDKLIDMGAQIILCDPHRAVVVGHDKQMKLRAGKMTSPDIRAGIALLIAAMSAEGTSRIHNIEQIDRGYEDIEARLNALGANIKRMD